MFTMFRTSNTRGQARFDSLRLSNFKRNGKLFLTKTQVKLIEDSSILSLGEKIELLLVALGNKLTTELYMNIRYEYDSETKKDKPNKSDLDAIEQLLQKLPFIYFKDRLERRNKNTGHAEDFNWYQVSVNEAVSHFMKKYPDDLTEFEEGILYGFPLSAIRAFALLIDESHDKPDPASNFLAGWCSKDFWEDEQTYYQLWWERLRGISPKIVEQAEKKFLKENG